MQFKVFTDVAGLDYYREHGVMYAMTKKTSTYHIELQVEIDRFHIETVETYGDYEQLKITKCLHNITIDNSGLRIHGETTVALLSGK